MVPGCTSSNVEHPGDDQASVSSTPVRVSIDGLSNGSSPSVTIRPPERVVVGSNLGPLKRVKSLGIGAGIWNDIRSRVPYYISDWTDAWNYRVVPATTLVFFAKYGVFSPERPGLRYMLFQCSSWDCFLFGPHRDYRKVWCYGGLTFFCHGCRGILGVWWTAAMHSGRYGYVFRRCGAGKSNRMVALPSQVLLPCLARQFTIFWARLQIPRITCSLWDGYIFGVRYSTGCLLF